MAVVPHINAPLWRTADFGNGTERVAWTSPLDPGEFKAYTVDCSREISGTNRIETYQVVPSGLATLAGLVIQDQSHDDTKITLWLLIAPDSRNRPNWDGAGEVHVITCSIESTDGQRYERDISLPIKQLGQS
jgi:hypothetical protein